MLESLEPNISELIDPSTRKVLEFLVENREFDYSKEEIAEGAEISRPTLYRIWPVLEKNGLLKERTKLTCDQVNQPCIGKKDILSYTTRKYANVQLFKINEDNEIVKLLIKLEIAAVKEQFKRIENKK